MASKYIPAGRTSIVTKGKTKFQLQTEYAGIPRPRITTTIFSEGQVLHKVEKVISDEVDTIEVMHQVEDVIKAQHLEISKVIRERGLPSAPESIIGSPQEKTRSENIAQLDDVEHVFRITADGKIANDRKITGQFKKMFKHVIRELPQMIMVFASLPGKADRREEGIYEIEDGRILLASTGVEFFLILVKPGTAYDSIAPRLKEILDL